MNKIKNLILFLIVFFTGSVMAFSLESSAFKAGEAIPSKYTCDGADISPPLKWQDAPQGTVSFVLTMDDPDAPRGVWDHWVVFNIPNTLSELIENHQFKNDVTLGKNSSANNKYNGPCPPNGEHRYFFKLYALDQKLNLPSSATKKDVEAAMQNHILGTAELMGRYKRR